MAITEEPMFADRGIHHLSFTPPNGCARGSSSSFTIRGPEGNGTLGELTRGLPVSPAPAAAHVLVAVPISGRYRVQFSVGSGTPELVEFEAELDGERDGGIEISAILSQWPPDPRECANDRLGRTLLASHARRELEGGPLCGREYIEAWAQATIRLLERWYRRYGCSPTEAKERAQSRMDYVWTHSLPTFQPEAGDWDSYLRRCFEFSLCQHQPTANQREQIATALAQRHEITLEAIRGIVDRLGRCLPTLHRQLLPFSRIGMARPAVRTGFDEELCPNPAVLIPNRDVLEASDWQSQAEQLLGAAVSNEQVIILQLTYDEQLPPRRIVERTGIPTEQISRFLNRFRDCLREQLIRESLPVTSFSAPVVELVRRALRPQGQLSDPEQTALAQEWRRFPRRLKRALDHRLGQSEPWIEALLVVNGFADSERSIVQELRNRRSPGCQEGETGLEGDES